jgi:hypothetical protein
MSPSLAEIFFREALYEKMLTATSDASGATPEISDAPLPPTAIPAT